MQLVDVKHKNKMLSAEKFCLKWNDFQDNLNSAFAGLKNDQDLTDVTLACEDGSQLQTHKVILASSSPIFMELLKTNKHPHPLLYMRGSILVIGEEIHLRRVDKANHILIFHLLCIIRK